MWSRSVSAAKQLKRLELAGEELRVPLPPQKALVIDDVEEESLAFLAAVEE
jgi:hypothetical protein